MTSFFKVLSALSFAFIVIHAGETTVSKEACMKAFGSLNRNSITISAPPVGACEGLK